MELSSPGWRGVVKFMQFMYQTFVLTPFEQLYMRGYWRGEALEDVCTRLTGHASSFWARHIQACKEVVAREMDVWFVIVIYGLYFVCLWLIIRSIAQMTCASARHFIFRGRVKRKSLVVAAPVGDVDGVGSGVGTR